MEMLQKICFVLLLTTLSSVYAGNCFEGKDIEDCRVKAEQGDSSAQYNLGVMYERGHGVSQDYNEVVKWYKKSAEQGESLAQYNLGVIYKQGKGVPQDYVMAHMFFNIASIGGDKDAVEDRDIVTNLMTPSQLEKAQDLAREWMHTH